MSRLLGIDLGERRIGLAVAEREREPARALTTVPRSADLAGDVDRLRRIIAEHGIIEIVVGLPLNAGGDEGPMARGARAWAAAIGEALGLPVRMRDEHLSSHRAETRLGPMPRGRSGGPPSPTQRDRYRARVDREAAAIILQDELDSANIASAGPGA